ncbi:unnamed protein product [Adineta steineri]|uniref:Uncharacterized protein n=1 Tax=Adineta steineri TaxID=433720 RepID=A0A818JTC6_9BILA|nr:unnamed protein product [Adineta steineri]
MEYNSGASMILPDSIDLIENDFDSEDIAHEQIKQNEIMELIAAAFEGNDGSFDDDEDNDDDDDDDDDRSLNTSDSSYHSSDEQQILYSNNTTDEHYIQQENELLHHNHPYQQVVFPNSTGSTPSTNNHQFENNDHSPTNLVNQYVYHTSSTNLNDTDNQLNKLRILCIAKEQKVSQLQNLCEEYRNKYENNTQTFNNKLELYEKAKYDLEQRYQMSNTKCEELFEINNQLNRTIKDSELRIRQVETIKTQYEQKLSDSESLIESLQHEIHKLQHFETMASSYQDFELILSTTHEKYEHEIISLNEKLHNIQMNLQEKNVVVDEFRTQLDTASKNNEKIVCEHLETIHHLNDQLQQYQRQYTDLLTKSSLESFNHPEVKQHLNRITEDKDKLEFKCQELQSEVRTLRERLSENEHEVNDAIFSIKAIPINNYDHSVNSSLHESLVQENTRLKERIDEFIFNEKNLTELNEDLQRRIQEYEYRLQRHDSSSSSSTNSGETVITTSTHMETLRNLTNEADASQRKYEELEEKYEYEKQELQTMIEQLREDVIDLDKTKHLYIDVCQEKNTIEDTLRTKFEFELKTKLDDLYKILEQDYNEKLLLYTSDPKNIKPGTINKDLEQSLTRSYEENKRLKVEHDKQITELNNELDRLRTNDDAKNRLIYIEKEFEQLKQDYSNLNIKQKELLNTCSILENENEQFKQENVQLKQNFEKEKERFLNEIKQLNELTEYQKQELSSLHNNIDYSHTSLKQENLQLKENFDNEKQRFLNEIKQLNELIGQKKQELSSLHENTDHNHMNLKQENLQLKDKIDNEKEKFLNEIKQLNELTEQQKQELSSLHTNNDDNHMNLKQDIESLQLRINNYENDITQYEILRVKLENNLQKLTKQRDTYKMDLKLTREILTNTENEYSQLKIHFDECEKQLQNTREHIKRNQLRSPLPTIQDTEHEYDEKILSLESEKCKFEQRLREANQALDLADSHLQQEIQKIRLSLEQEYNRRYEHDQRQHQHELAQLRKELTNPIEKQHVVNTSNNIYQDTEDIKKMYRTEIDRLSHENIELSQHQAKLIDTHQKQMQIMKKELDDGYNNVINEFQREQTRLQTRCDQLKQQLINAQQVIEQLKSNLNLLRPNQFEYEDKNRKDNLQARLENLIKLLEQSNDALNQERMLHAKQEYEYQQTISSLQKKIADMIKQHIEAVGEIKRELYHERSTNTRHMVPRPTSVPEFAENDLLADDMKYNYPTTIAKLRVTTALYMDNLESQLKKQIQNELIRSRNSMIKEIRREILEKITRVLTSQKVPDTTIDKYVFELDRLLSQMVQDCSTSLSNPSPLPLNSSNLSIQITPQSRHNRAVIYHSLPSKSTPPIRKSIECLYMTPTVNKQPLSITPHGHRTLNNDSRPKSASYAMINNRHSLSSTYQPPYTHKFQQLPNKNHKTKTHRSEDDLVLGVQTKSNLDNDKHQQGKVRVSTKQYEQQTNSLPGYSRSKTRMSDGQCTISPTRMNNQEENDEKKEVILSSTTSPTIHTSGIKKFVLSGLKLFVTAPSQSK